MPEASDAGSTSAAGTPASPHRSIVIHAVLVTLLLGSIVPTSTLSASEPDERIRATDPAPDRRLYLGMWTMHFRERERGIDANHLVGVSVGRAYAGTFINSFDRRAYTAGLQGNIASWSTGPVSMGVGYRAGLVTGYDERFIPIAAKTPVLPLLQPLLRADGRRFGAELSWSGVIMSAAMNARF